MKGNITFSKNAFCANAEKLPAVLTAIRHFVVHSYGSYTSAMRAEPIFAVLPPTPFSKELLGGFFIREPLAELRISAGSVDLPPESGIKRDGVKSQALGEVEHDVHVLYRLA